MIGNPPVCYECKHFHEDSGMPYTCDAFPDGDGIPDEILVKGNPHTEPFPGDNGIRFEPKTSSVKKAIKALKKKRR